MCVSSGECKSVIICPEPSYTPCGAQWIRTITTSHELKCTITHRQSGDRGSIYSRDAFISDGHYLRWASFVCARATCFAGASPLCTQGHIDRLRWCTRHDTRHTHWVHDHYYTWRIVDQATPFHSHIQCLCVCAAIWVSRKRQKALHIIIVTLCIYTRRGVSSFLFCLCKRARFATSSQWRAKKNVRSLVGQRERPATGRHQRTYIYAHGDHHGYGDTKAATIWHQLVLVNGFNWNVPNSLGVSGPVDALLEAFITRIWSATVNRVLPIWYSFGFVNECNQCKR